MAGCEGPAALSPEEGLALQKGHKNSGSQAELIKDVRQATARFHSTVQAVKAGYVPDPHCVAAPGLGTMGHHWVNPSLMDPVFDPLRPEALLYAPDRNGNLKLVAVEYIVINVGQPQPMFAGRPFDVGGVPPLGDTPHWSLHVWVWEENPSGMFAPFNPNLSCG
jgi:hypothetical protein